MTYNEGDRVGDYEVVAILGAGGMGKVYKVRNLISQRFEAMKVLLPNLEADPDLADRFMREIRVQASLQHPNIAALHTAQRINNQLIMLIEYVEGTTLEAELRKGRIPVAKSLEYVRQVLLALASAHARGVVHRDIKPANIMLTPNGTVKLMDFGIARLAEDRKLTRTGSTVGSLFYMSPEQIQGAADLDARSDLYSLGVSLYEMLTGRRPFQGDSDYSIMAAHLSARPVPPVELDPTLPAVVNEAVLMAIAKEPSQRFQSADAFRTALESVTGILQNTPPAPLPRAETATAVMPAAVAPSIPATANRRGWYIAIGSVMTLLVLALAALQAPRIFGPSSASPPATPVAQPAVQTTPQMVPSAAAPEIPADSYRELAVRATTPQVDHRPARTAAQKSYSPTTAATQVSPPAETTAKPAVETPVVTPSVDNARQNALRDTLIMLATRANSARASLSSLKQQQARMGLSLRGDISTAEQQMETFLDDAETASKANDPERMRKSLASAERALEAIEKFLGR